MIKRLKECGLSYIYFGLESTNPSSVITIHKATNGNGKEVSWEKRAETAVKNLHEMGIQIGISNIFCMHPDEKQSNRIKQLSLIHEWQEKYPGTIVSLSLNIQTVHAGDMVDGEYPLYDYTRW